MEAPGRRRIIFFGGAFLRLLLASAAFSASAGQQYEEMSDSVRSSLRREINQTAPPRLFFAEDEAGRRWLDAMDLRLSRLLPDDSILQDRLARREFLTGVHHESLRAGLDPQLVLSVIHVESAFRKYAISVAGARGLMQVMPFWTDEIGDGNARNLFQARANLRYGTVILRHYLDIEGGDLNRALGRYNGSLGSSKYPNLVYDKLKKYWTWEAER